MMKKQGHLTRREFLHTTGKAAAMLAAASAPNFIPATARGALAPSNRVTLAMIGVGNQGFQDMKAFLAEPDAQIVAVCDVNRGSGGYRNVSQFCGREPAKQVV